MATETLSEAEKMRLAPGIVFADGPTGRRARIAGTGLDVFEIIIAYHSCGGNRQALAEAFDQLSAEQLDAAFAYYDLFPEEINLRLQAQAVLTPEVIRAKYEWPDTYRRPDTR